MRNMMKQQLQQTHNAEFDEFMKVARYERSENRRNYRNGSYARTLHFRAGKLELQICRDREGEFSAELFSRYQRHEKALCSAFVEVYIKGLSTRKVNDIVEKLFGLLNAKSHSFQGVISGSAVRFIHLDMGLNKDLVLIQVNASKETIHAI